MEIIVLNRIHEVFIHPVENSTIGILKGRFWWPSMTTQIKDYVKKCVICSQVKAQSKS